MFVPVFLCPSTHLPCLQLISVGRLSVYSSIANLIAVHATAVHKTLFYVKADYGTVFLHKRDAQHHRLQELQHNANVNAAINTTQYLSFGFTKKVIKNTLSTGIHTRGKRPRAPCLHGKLNAIRGL